MATEEKLTRAQLLARLNSVLASKTARSAIISRYKDETYSKTYPHYVSLLKKNRRAKDESCYAFRVAVVGSWVATILKPDFCDTHFQEYISFIKKIEKENEVTCKQIGDALKCANRCLNRSSSANIATASKLLHLDLPETFPILDVNVGRAVFKRDVYLSQQRYQLYSHHLQNIVREKPKNLVEFKNQLEEEMGYEIEISDIRAADIALFDKGKRLRRKST